MADQGSDLLNKLLRLPDGSSAKKDAVSHKKMVDAIGNYLQTTKSSLMGSKSGEEDLVEIEGLVHSWYKKALKDNAGEALQDKLQKASTGLGQIVNNIEINRGIPRKQAHFDKIIEVGKHLRNAAELMDDD